jgi:translocation and assembly module TamB
VMPFTVESGDLSTYRVVATAQFRDVMLELPDYGLLVDDLDALIPVEQELATYPKLFIVPNRTANAMTQKRFFDLYPFSKRESFFTVDRLQLGQEMVGPLAANVQIVGSTVAVDQVHASYRGGYITGQVLADVGRDDPEVSFRGNITGVETTRGRGVLDANLAMTFVPTTLIVEGKAQVVSVSKDHLYEIIDVLDPYHEDEGLNRVRFGLKFGYPKYVRLNMDEGLMDAKIDLGGLAGAVRIDEIKGIPVTPFIEEYVQPYLERVLLPAPAAQALVAETEGT